MSDLSKQSPPGPRACASCVEETLAPVVRALAHGDADAWIAIRDHFEKDVKGHVASSPEDSRNDVLSAVTTTLFATLARDDIYRVNDIHSYVRAAMRNARINVLRARVKLRRHETAIPPTWDTPDLDAANHPGSHEDADALDRCLEALSEAKVRMKGRPLAVMCVQVVEMIFLADIDGERIDRVEACRRLGLSHELTNISPKLSRARTARRSFLHDVISDIDPMLLSLLEDRTPKGRS